MIRRQKIWKARNWDGMDGMDGIGGCKQNIVYYSSGYTPFMDGRRISFRIWFGNIMM